MFVVCVCVCLVFFRLFVVEWKRSGFGILDVVEAIGWREPIRNIASIIPTVPSERNFLQRTLPRSVFTSWSNGVHGLSTSNWVSLYLRSSPYQVHCPFRIDSPCHCHSSLHLGCSVWHWSLPMAEEQRRASSLANRIPFDRSQSSGASDRRGTRTDEQTETSSPTTAMCEDILTMEPPLHMEAMVEAIGRFSSLCSSWSLWFHCLEHVRCRPVLHRMVHHGLSSVAPQWTDSVFPSDGDLSYLCWMAWHKRAICAVELWHRCCWRDDRPERTTSTNARLCPEQLLCHFETVDTVVERCIHSREHRSFLLSNDRTSEETEETQSNDGISSTRIVDLLFETNAWDGCLVSVVLFFRRSLVSISNEMKKTKRNGREWRKMPSIYLSVSLAIYLSFCLCMTCFSFRDINHEHRGRPPSALPTQRSFNDDDDVGLSSVAQLEFVEWHGTRQTERSSAVGHRRWHCAPPAEEGDQEEDEQEIICQSIYSDHLRRILTTIRRQRHWLVLSLSHASFCCSSSSSFCIVSSFSVHFQITLWWIKKLKRRCSSPTNSSTTRQRHKQEMMNWVDWQSTWSAKRPTTVWSPTSFWNRSVWPCPTDKTRPRQAPTNARVSSSNIHTRRSIVVEWCWIMTVHTLTSAIWVRFFPVLWRNSRLDICALCSDQLEIARTCRFDVAGIKTAQVRENTHNQVVVTSTRAWAISCRSRFNSEWYLSCLCRRHAIDIV